jgi:DNA-binding PadR family transcriptional regulator
VLLGLLEPRPTHGYTLKAAYDSRFGQERPLRYGQVYATLARLQREGWAQEVAVEPGAGPDRRTYAVTPAGVQELSGWLVTPEPPTAYAHGVLFAKTVLALTSGRSAADVLDAQREVHVRRMREVLRAARGADVLTRLAADHEVAHLEADLAWIETAGARLTEVAL